MCGRVWIGAEIECRRYAVELLQLDEEVHPIVVELLAGRVAEDVSEFGRHDGADSGR